jgi:peptidase S24-like protein
VKTFTAVRALAAEGPVAATVRGASMAPLLADGDRVAIARARVYLPGDVVAFRTEGPGESRLVVHRLLGYRLHHGRLACVTQGDAAPLPDPPVALAHLLGRVVAHPGSAPLVPPRARWAALAVYLRLAARRFRRALARSRP